MSAGSVSGSSTHLLCDLCQQWIYPTQESKREKDRDESEGRSLLLFVHLKCYCLLASSFTQSDD